MALTEANYGDARMSDVLIGMSARASMTVLSGDPTKFCTAREESMHIDIDPSSYRSKTVPGGRTHCRAGAKRVFWAS